MKLQRILRASMLIVLAASAASAQLSYTVVRSLDVSPLPGGIAVCDLNDAGAAAVTHSFGNTTMQQNAYVWTSAGLTGLGNLGGSSCSAYGINEASEIVGVSQTAPGSSAVHAWRRPAAALLDLGTFGIVDCL